MPRRSTSLRTLVTCLALGWLGCRPTVAEQLEGRWLGKEVEMLGGEVSAQAEGWVRGTRLSFSGSELTVAVPGQPSRTGSYAVANAKDGHVVLKVQGHHGHVQETRLTIETERLMRWHLSERQTVVLERM